MPKTITIRIDDDIYEMFKKAADGNRRSISNFVVFATLSYLTNEIQQKDQIKRNEEAIAHLKSRFSK